jgi:hypothetical protein
MWLLQEGGGGGTDQEDEVESKMESSMVNEN